VSGVYPATIKTILATVFLLAAWPAAADDPRASEMKYIWSKSCARPSKDELRCSVSVYAKAGCFPAGGRILIGDNFTLTLFTRHVLKTGAIDIQIDDAVPVYTSAACSDLVCTAQLAIDNAFLERLKRGRILSVQAVDSTNRDIRLSIPLDDFASVYDGPATPSSGTLYLRTSAGKDDVAKRAALMGLPVCNE
jgi:invasion protein IalB